jgi:hypothetical protein
VLGLEDQALGFYHTISLATVVSQKSRMYWERAAYRPLNIRPDIDDEDIDDVDRFGPQYLREYEAANRRAAASGDKEAHDTGTVEDETAELGERVEENAAATLATAIDVDGKAKENGVVEAEPAIEKAEDKAKEGGDQIVQTKLATEADAEIVPTKQ